MVRHFSLLLMSLLSGCNDRYEEGYAAGFQAAETAARVRESNSLVEQERYREPASPASEVTTEVCGGFGVDFNGRHITGGKTGCVRVFSDGRVQRY